MKVLVSKYEISAIADKWPLFADCPDYVEVSCILPSVGDLTPEQRARLVSGLKVALAKQAKRNTKPKSRNSKKS
jgi:hypothetical protein